MTLMYDKNAGYPSRVLKETAPPATRRSSLQLTHRKAGQWPRSPKRPTGRTTIRGFISGNVTKKMRLTVESSKNEAGERTYRIAK